MNFVVHRARIFYQVVEGTDDCLQSKSPTFVENSQDDGAKRHYLQKLGDLVPGARRSMYEHRCEVSSSSGKILLVEFDKTVCYMGDVSVDSN